MEHMPLSWYNCFKSFHVSSDLDLYSPVKSELASNLALCEGVWKSSKLCTVLSACADGEQRDHPGLVADTGADERGGGERAKGTSRLIKPD